MKVIFTGEEIFMINKHFTRSVATGIQDRKRPALYGAGFE